MAWNRVCWSENVTAPRTDDDDDDDDDDDERKSKLWTEI